MKEVICWLQTFRNSPKSGLLVGVSTDSEIGMSSLYAARPDLETYTDCGGRTCNYNPWDFEASFDYQDQFDYRGRHPVECESSPAPQPQYCTGGVRHEFVDAMIGQFGGDIGAFNTEMGTDLHDWWANHAAGSADHFRDGYSVQNNPPVCEYYVPGYEYWRCIYRPQTGPIPYNQNYINTWTAFRRQVVQTWVQRTADWITCSNPGAAGQHMWPCPLADAGCPVPSGGLPTYMVFTHQASDPSPQDHFCSPLWTAQVTNGQVGLTAYDLQAASLGTDWDHPDDYNDYFFQVKSLADGQDNRYRWGFFEWNPIDWDCYDPEYDINYQTLLNLYNCGASVVCPYRWPSEVLLEPCGGTWRRPYQIEGTSLQSAIYNFLSNHYPYDPCPPGQACIYLPLVLKRPCTPGGALAPTRAPPSGYPPLPTPEAYPPPPTPPPSPTPAPSPTPTPWDTTPPQSSAGLLPVYHNTSSFNVTWFGHDDRSGIEEFNLQYRDGIGGQWLDWLSYPIPFFAAFTDAQDGHTYYFRCGARDHAGNEEDWPTDPDYDAFTTVDLTPPASSATSPPYDNATPIPVSWTASDATSGVASTALWYRFGGGGWTDSGLSQGGTSGSFDFTPAGGDGTYYFATRARDHAGNLEAVPGGSGDDHTVYDTVPPSSQVSALPTYTYQSPFTVHWSGTDDLSGLDHYDLFYRDESAAGWTFWLSAPPLQTWASFSGQAGRTYHFCSRGVDQAGNPEPCPPPGVGEWPIQSDARTSVAPGSRVSALPPYTGSRTFLVSWSGSPGVQGYDVQVRDGPYGAWNTWKSNVPYTQASYTGQWGHIYYFRSRARQGTVWEVYPYDYDTYTKLVEPAEAQGPPPPREAYPPDEAPDRMEEVTRTQALGLPVVGYIAPQGDVDWYRFEVTETMRLRVTLYDLPADYDLYLFDATGEFLWASTWGRQLPEEVVVRVPAGVYYVQLAGYAGAWDGEVPYRLLAEPAGGP